MAAALLLLRHARGDREAADAFERVAAAFPQRLRGVSYRDLAEEGLRLRVWGTEDRLGHARGPDGSWVAVVGNPTRRDLRPLPFNDRIEKLLADGAVDARAAFTDVSAPFVSVTRDVLGNVVAAADRCGLQHAYISEQGSGRVWLSSSSLALAAGTSGTIDPEALAEWLAVGHFITGRTLFAGIRKLSCGEVLEIDEAHARQASVWAPPSNPLRNATRTHFTDTFLSCLENCDTDNRVAMELTGGLDTRLILAGNLSRNLGWSTWTLGQPGCDELRTIDRLKLRATFDHFAATLDHTIGLRLPALASEMHELADGEVNAIEYAPLLLAFDQLAGKRDVSVTGSGGENARGFYYRVLRRGGDRLRGVPVEALFALVTKFTAGVRHALHPSIVGDPDEAAREGIRDFVRSSPAATPKAILDDFYIRARMQRFAGRNITTTGLFCAQGAPFFGNDLLEVIVRLPDSLKTDGRVVRESIIALAPELGAVPLDTGIAVVPPSWRRPWVSVRRGVALGRKALIRYGGETGRRLAAVPPETVPWEAARAARPFRDFVAEHLLGPDVKVHDFLRRSSVENVVHTALSGGNLYPMGLLLTLELTLRRLASARR